MKKFIALLLLSLSLFFCGRKNDEDFYTIGIFQFNDAPHLNEVRKGVIQALWDHGFQDGVNIQLEIRNGNGSTPEVQRIAQEFVEMEVDMIIALSTPALQAALIATHEIPIIFSSVANPYLAGAGRSAQDHMRTVTGVTSRGPIRESLLFIRGIIPGAKRLGTLWTPSEINSEFYLELAREEGKKVGLEIVDVPIANKSQVLHSAQVLINKKIDAIYQISDNTINESFQDVGHVAGENSVPLFGGFLLSTRHGACAALGWDFSEMGYTTGEIAIRVKNGENPADIPIQSMSKVRIHLNLLAAEKQGIKFADELLNRADQILKSEENLLPLSDS
ncbi:MAG: ABC transporter substrate-binding protein [Candidatus Aminicenantes bacterium]|nr:MAG: ABC transporter substrate-binding protein [Candidatus Aminicenantes bacterium]